MNHATRLLSGLALASVLAMGLGCPPSPTGPDTKHGDDHEALEGPHHGPIIEWGDEEYHLEFTVDHKKQEARVYVFGPDHNKWKPAPIKADKLMLAIKDPKVQIELKPEKQASDPEGTASVFVGKDEKLGVEKEFAGSVSGEVNGKPYAGDFKEEAGADHGHKH